jgi:hypothetical protein
MLQSYLETLKYVPVILGAVMINYSNNQSYLVAVFWEDSCYYHLYNSDRILLFFKPRLQIQW